MARYELKRMGPSLKVLGQILSLAKTADQTMRTSLLLLEILFAEFVWFSFMQLPKAFGASRVNPIGVLSSYLVFDGWDNIVLLSQASAILFFNIILLKREQRVRTALAAVALANFAGIASSMGFLLSGYSAPVSLFNQTFNPNLIGMSASACALAAFALTLGLPTVFLKTSLWHPGPEARFRGSFAPVMWMIMANPMITSLLLALAKPPAIQFAHSLGILSGVLCALLLICAERKRRP